MPLFKKGFYYTFLIIIFWTAMFFFALTLQIKPGILRPFMFGSFIVAYLYYIIQAKKQSPDGFIGGKEIAMPLLGGMACFFLIFGAVFAVAILPRIFM